jgi:hypothetical protein
MRLLGCRLIRIYKAITLFIQKHISARPGNPAQSHRFDGITAPATVFVIPSTLHQGESRLVERAALIEDQYPMAAFNGVPATLARSTGKLLNLSVRSPVDWDEYLQCIELRNSARHEGEFSEFLKLVIHMCLSSA